LKVSGGNKDDVTLKKVFVRFDKSEDGYISFVEFEKMINGLKIAHSPKNLTTTFF
jgi:Ca2+-binding EF-hand superfamily protein